MPEVIITENTVPGTDVLITVSRKTSLVDGEVYYLTTRQPGTSDFVNYLQCGRATEEEAHKQADFLWEDTVQRRDAPRFFDSGTYEIGQYVAATCRRCNDRTGQHVQSSTDAGLVLKCGRCHNRSLHTPLVRL